MRDIVLYIGMSVDGFIADDEHNVDWIGGDDFEFNGVDSYGNFIKNIDTVIMGYKTYELVTTKLSPDSWPYKELKTFVFTSREMEDKKDIFFVDEKIDEFLGKLKKEEGKNIWICGGANIVNQLVKTNLIDRYEITTIPIILGKGIRLFNENNNKISLKLISTQVYNGFVESIYNRK